MGNNVILTKWLTSGAAIVYEIVWMYIHTNVSCSCRPLTSIYRNTKQQQSKGLSVLSLGPVAIQYGKT